MKGGSGWIKEIFRRLRQQGLVTDWMEGVREEAVSAVTFQSGFPDRQNVRVSKIGVKEKNNPSIELVFPRSDN